MTGTPPREPVEVQVSRAEVLTEAFKGLLLVNGGGAVALLAFLQAVWATEPALAQVTLRGIGLMALGVILALLVPTFRYFHSHAHRAIPAAATDRKTPYWWLFILCLALSVACFLAAIAYLVFAGGRLLL